MFFSGATAADFLFLPAKFGKGILAVCLVFQRHGPFTYRLINLPLVFSNVSVLPMGARMQSRTLITVSLFLFFLKLSGSVAQHFIIISRARSIGETRERATRVQLFFVYNCNYVLIWEVCFARNKWLVSMDDCLKSGNGENGLIGLFIYLNRDR